MRTLEVSAALLVLGAMVVGCSEQDPPTAATDDLTVPAFNFTNGPSNPSPVVARYEDQAHWAIWTDPARDLLAIYIITTDNVICGGSEGPFNLVDRQRLDTPSQVEHVSVLIKDSGSAVGVYGTANVEEFFDDVCGFLEGPKKLAAGTVDYSFGASASNNNSTYTVRGVGFLDGVDGHAYHFLMVQRLVQGLGWIVEDIRLVPVPGQ